MQQPKTGFFETLDPDFDEEWGWGDCTLLEHEIETTGTIALHPDGDRRADDPVPLHTRVYDDGTLSEFKKREWKRYLEDRKLWAEERAEIERRWGANRPPPVVTVVAEVPEPPLPPPPPKPVTPLEEVLAYMQPDKPIHRGHGRVMNQHVMINAADEEDWQNRWQNRNRTGRGALVEVWRGQGLVIFRR